MRSSRLLLLPLVCIFIINSKAQAGEGLFSRVYTTETVPGGHYEIEELVRNRFGRAYGDYSALDSKTEFEYGVTDNLQAAFYVNSGYVSAQGAPDDDDPSAKAPPDGIGSFTRSNLFLQSLSAEFIYRLMSPVTDPVGIALYIEPEYYFYDNHNGLRYNRTMSTEYRLLIQKDFLEDQLILAYNLVLETEFIRFEGPDAEWKGELDFNNEIGLTYRFAPNWYGGLEARNHNEIGDFERHEHSVYWVGPAFHYGGPSFWATFGVLKQVYGVPNGYDENGVLIGKNSEFLRSHEDWEITLKGAIPF